MLSPNYSIQQSLKMLTILGKNRVMISSLSSPWPEHVKIQFGDSEFFFDSRGIISARTVKNEMVSWKGPVPIDDFWTQKISQSVSFQCAKYLKSLQKKVEMKNIGHLLCKFYNLDYVTSSIIL